MKPPPICTTNCYGAGDGKDFEVGGETAVPEGPESPRGGVDGSSPDRYSYTETKFVAACSGNTVDRADNICNNALTCPRPVDTRYWIYRRTITVDVDGTPPETAGAWERVPGDLCRPPDADDGPSVAEILATVRSEFVRKRPAVPQVVVKPAPQVLMSARNSFSAGSAAPVELRDTVLGFPVVITATPRRWEWDFGDGERLTTIEPGEAGSLAVSHAYARAGDFSVSVTVEWTGTFRIGGVAGEFPITGVARVPSAPVVLQSREARTELVDR